MFGKTLNSSLQPVTTCGKAPSQMFDKVLNSPFWPLMISEKRIILDVWQGSEHASAIYTTINIRGLPVRGVEYLFNKLS